MCIYIYIYIYIYTKDVRISSHQFYYPTIMFHCIAEHCIQRISISICIYIVIYHIYIYGNEDLSTLDLIIDYS